MSLTRNITNLSHNVAKNCLNITYLTTKHIRKISDISCQTQLSAQQVINSIQSGNAGLASHGGFKDWFISELRKPGFTMEIGKGENPLPVSQLYEIYSRIEEALVLFALM